MPQSVLARFAQLTGPWSEAWKGPLLKNLCELRSNWRHGELVLLRLLRFEELGATATEVADSVVSVTSILEKLVVAEADVITAKNLSTAKRATSRLLVFNKHAVRLRLMIDSVSLPRQMVLTKRLRTLPESLGCVIMQTVPLHFGLSII